jgi:hypothetical protein
MGPAFETQRAQNGLLLHLEAAKPRTILAKASLPTVFRKQDVQHTGATVHGHPLSCSICRTVVFSKSGGRKCFAVVHGRAAIRSVVTLGSHGRSQLLVVEAANCRF